jgi:hypothetical protein
MCVDFKPPIIFVPLSWYEDRLVVPLSRMGILMGNLYWTVNAMKRLLSFAFQIIFSTPLNAGAVKRTTHLYAHHCPFLFFWGK